MPFPNKISCFVSRCVSSDNSFLSVREEPSFGPWKGSPFLQQMATLVGLFFTATDILTTRGTQGPACLPMGQTQWPQLGPFCPWSPPDVDNWPECPDWVRNKRLLTSLLFPLSFLSLTLPILPRFLVPRSWTQESGRRALSLS